MLTTVIVPARVPTAEGAKLTASEMLLPGARDTFPENPSTPNPAPETATWEIVRVPVALFVSEMDCEVEVPTKVLGKLTLLVLADKAYVTAGDVAVPDTATAREEGSRPRFSRLTTMLPAKLPAALG